MAGILANIGHERCLVYLDDVVAFSKTFAEHLQTLEMILQNLVKHNLKLKPEKCDFAKEKVTFLGHVVSSKGVEPDPGNISKVKNYPEPKTIKQVRTYLGLTSYYRKFIQNYAKIAAPLNKLLRKNAPFEWGPAQHQAFATLKDALISPPILCYPDFDKEFIVQTDASQFALGAILSQKDNGLERPVAYASRTLSKPEMNYSTTEKECLAIVYALKHFRPYVYGRKFKVSTDHKALEYVMKHKDPSSRLMRWALLLQEYDMEIEYRAGAKNGNADAMSRIPEPTRVCAVTRQQSKPDLTPEQERLKQAQEVHPLYSAIKAKLKGQPLPHNMSKENRTYIRNNWEQFRLRKDVLYYINSMNQFLLVLPDDFAKRMFLEVHAGSLGGHLGPDKTLSRLQPKYFWPRMAADVKEWTQACVACEQKKRPHANTKVPLKSIPVSSRPFHKIGMDVVGPLPTSNKGNKYLLVATDYLTKWPEAMALPDQTASTIAQAYLDLIVCRHGAPETLITDRGRNFTSKLMAELCKLTQTNKVFTTSFHPQTDGLCEKLNGTLVQILSFMVSQNQRNWDEFVNMALFAYRAARHATIKQSPFKMLYGREPKMPVDNLFIPNDDEQNTTNGSEEFVTKLHEIWTTASENIERAQQTQKRQYDKRVTANVETFAVGDKVYCRTPKPRVGLTKKLQKPYQGPMRIVDLNETNARVQWADGPRSKPTLVHLNRLKRAYNQRNDDSLLPQANERTPENVAFLGASQSH